MTLYTLQNHPVTLTAELGSGGAGTVYEVAGQPQIVAKLYHQPPAPEQVARLQALAQCEHERLTKIAAWPVGVLHDQPDGKVVGFLMPRVDGASEIHALHSPRSRLQKFPDATWTFLIHVAANIARAVATVHEAGFVIGDVNPKNILVTRQGTVALLDCDSFQFTSAGQTYRCEAGFPEYTPPELQGFAFRDVDRTPQHDAFGLAVVIFQLLFLGRHPFAGKFLGEGEMPLSRAIAEGRFAYGERSAERQMIQPPGTLPWRALPAGLAEHFERSFLTAERVAPHEWIETLDAAAQTVTTCALHQGHRYAAGLAACPWCEIEMQARVKLFNVTRKGEGQSTAFRLNEVWREIEQIEAPNLLELARNEFQWVQEPAEASRKLAKRREEGFILALVVAALGGFVTAYLGGFCAFIGMSWVALVIAHICLKLEPHSLTIPANQPSPSKLSDALKKARDEAAAKVRQLEQQWEWDVNGRFVAKRGELHQHYQHYASLEATRDDRLQQLEAAAWEDRLKAHLEQFEIQNSEISGRVLTTYLKVKGMKTAADITRERLDGAMALTNTHRTILWNWRNYKEQQLVREPDALVHPTLRQRVVTETEAMRERLEAELRSGALYLRRLRNEVEASQLAVRDELMSAKQSLAQAEADFKAAGKRRSLTIPVMVLIGAGVIGGIFSQVNHYDDFDLHRPDLATVEAPPPKPMPEMNDEARKLFSEAMDYRRSKIYDRAIKLLTEAQLKDSNSLLVRDELSFTCFLAGRYEQAIEQATSSPDFGSRYRPHKNLGLAYAAVGKWQEARKEFLRAIELRDQEHLRDFTALVREDVELRYFLSQAFKELGELPEMMKQQEISLVGLSPDSSAYHQALIEKILYWLWHGKMDVAKQNLLHLRQQNGRLADIIEEFVNQHPLNLIPPQAPKPRRR